MKIEYLIEKYADLVYKICYNMLSSPEGAEDMCQETYISLYINLEKYNSLKEDEFKNLICKIALNKCRDYLRANKSKKQDFLSDNIVQFEDLKNQVRLDENILQKEKENNIRNAINNLKEPYKTIIYEYYINEKTLDELAIQTNRSKGTIKMQLHRGKENLKKKYDKVRR